LRSEPRPVRIRVELRISKKFAHTFSAAGFCRKTPVARRSKKFPP
jgi:hypothetical protein